MPSVAGMRKAAFFVADSLGLDVQKEKKPATIFPNIIRNSDPDPFYSAGLIPQIPAGGNMPQVSGIEQILNDSTGNLITLNRSVLNNVYARYGIIHTVVDLPIEDAFRGGLTFKSSQLSHSELGILTREFERRLLDPIKQAMKWCRLFGGAVLVINTSAKPSEPFSPDEIKQGSAFQLEAFDRWELSYPFTSYELNDEAFMFTYHGQQIHSSRVIRLVGLDAPSMIRQRLQGWGLSAIEQGLRELNTYSKVLNSIFEYVDEYKIDVIKILSYNEALAANASDAGKAVYQRLQLAAQTKNYQNALVLDSEDDFVQRQPVFSGLAEVVKHVQVMQAAAFQFPVTKMFGLSAAGFNAGDDDIENYNSVVEGEHRFKGRQYVNKVLPLLAQSIFGYAPDDIDFSFRPLRTLNAEQEETVKNFKLERYSRLFEQQVITREQYLSCLRHENIVTVEDFSGGNQDEND